MENGTETFRRPIRRIACMGEVMIELSGIESDTATVGVAGDTYNAAVYLARCLRGTGTEISYVTALGDDAFSDRIVAHMREHDVVDRAERRTGMAPGLYAVTLDARGERSFTYWRSASAARTLFAEPGAVEALAAFDLVFLSGITLAILSPATRAALTAFLADFRADGGTVAYDGNYRPALWQDAGTARQWSARMWSLADIALPSLDDETALFGDADERATIDRLAAAGATRGALKRGAAGPVDLATGKTLEGVRPRSVVDATAAGDSFDAAHIAALVRGADLLEAMRAGHELAAHVVGHHGAIVPERTEPAP